MTRRYPPIIENLTEVTIAVKITQFHPIGSLQGNIMYAYSLDPRTKKLPVKVHLNKKDHKITLAPKKGFSGEIDLVFVLNDPNHLMIGLAYAAADLDHMPSTGNPRNRLGGVTSFPSIRFERKKFGGVLDAWETRMHVRDTLQTTTDNVYAYYILVQEVSSGNLGLIDPMMVNEPPP